MKEIDPGLHSLQAEVGGDIGATYPYSDPVALVCNDEGKLIGLDVLLFQGIWNWICTDQMPRKRRKRDEC